MGVRAFSLHWAFLFFQGTLSWQSIKFEKLAFFLDQSTLLLCHSETLWDNALCIRDLTASQMPQYSVKFS